MNLLVISARSKAALLLVITMFFVSFVTVLAKQTLENVSAINFVWLQMLFALISMALYTIVWRHQRVPTDVPRSAWLLVCLIGVMNFAIVKTLFTLALQILPVTTHAYLINFVGITTMLLSALFLKERPAIYQIGGAIIALLGIHIYFLVFPEGNLWYGVLLSTLTVIFLAITNILIRLLQVNYSNVIPANIVSLVAVAVGGLPLIVYGVYDVFVVPKIAYLGDSENLIRTRLLSSITFYDWLVILANGFIAISINLSVFNSVMQQLKAFEASILASTGLIFTAIFSVIILEDSLSANQLLGIALLLVGIGFVQFQRVSNKSF